jgi:diguanylate cyclase (GGDEF)-like protein
MAATKTPEDPETRRFVRLPRPGPSTWLFLVVAGAYEVVPAANAAWSTLVPRLPDAGPLVVALAAALFGLGFHQIRLAALGGLFAALLFVLDTAGGAVEHGVLLALMLALDLAWIGLLPARARLGWRSMAAFAFLALQAVTFERWAPTAHELVAPLTGRLDTDAGILQLTGIGLVGLLPWLVRAVLGGASLPLAAVWSCLSLSLAIAAGAETTGRPDLHRWLAPVLVLLALAEASYRLAFTDELTGLAGRRALMDALAGLRGEYAVAVVDIDHFKSFNDRHGHEVGDQVLRLVASELRTVAGAEAFRLGGEEFALVFARAGIDDAEPALDGLRRRVAERRFVVRSAGRPKRRPRAKGSGGRAGTPASTAQPRKVTVSVGLAGPSARRTDPGAVLDRADQALYRAKRAGRNRVVVAGR